MWKPNKVVSEHKRRARTVWIVLLITTLAYTISQVVDVADQYKNPSTTLSISNDPYDYPSVHMCFMDGYGCEFEEGDSSTCMDSMSSTVYFDGEISSMTHTFSGVYDNCIAFDLSTLEASVPTSSSALEESPYIMLQWTVSAAASNASFYSEMIGVMLGDFDTFELTYIPYTRTEFPRTEAVAEAMSVMMIQKTHRTHLSGFEEDMFAVWSIATAATIPIEATEFGVETGVIGRLLLKLEQAPYSLVGISDDRPLSVGSLLGNVGGFWELLLVAWAVFFVSTRNESEPEFKARNLTKAVKKGREAVGNRLRWPRASATPETTEVEAEATPDWEAPYRAALATSDSVRENSNTGVGASDLSGHQTLSASFWRRPVEHPNPSRASGISSPPPPV